MALLVLLGAGCADDDDAVDDGAGDGVGDVMPGEGVSVEMARANWSTGYFQAEIFEVLLEELGYDVSDPSETELGPDTFYPALAQGELDFWANGWFPIHEPSLQGELPDGTIIADNVSPVGFEVAAGALQGYLIDKATAEEFGITTVDQINDDPEITELFDVDGDGSADLIGCNEGWGCAKTINETIELNDWENIEHVQAEYSVLFTDVLARYQQDEPVFYYTWTPNFTVAQLVPGIDVVWLAVENPPREQDVVADLTGDECPAEDCRLGFVPADIRAVANDDFLDENPAARRLFELIEIPPADIFDQNLRMNEGADSQSDIEAAAEQWVEDNRVLIDEWLDEARTSA